MTHPATAVLVSGGLDSCILLAHLAQNRPVTPIYVRSGHLWEPLEAAALQRFLTALRQQQPGLVLNELCQLEMPTGDIYPDHWSTTGKHVPAAGTRDEAVFLPGRNMLLHLKAALWCQLNGIGVLASGVLQGNPFADASPPFFSAAQQMLNAAGLPQVQLIQPLADKSKAEVMQLGQTFPLAETFSCLAPQAGFHCGQCNKCDERQRAFATLGNDPTKYAKASQLVTAR